MEEEELEEEESKEEKESEEEESEEEEELEDLLEKRPLLLLGLRSIFSD